MTTHVTMTLSITCSWSAALLHHANRVVW